MRFSSSLVSIILATTTISITSKENVNNGRLLRISNAQNKERKEVSKNIISCGSINEEEYIPITDIKSINIENANKKVMISYDIKNDKEMVACTAMICPSSLNDKCCNTCSSTPKFDNINLIPSNAHLQMGCSGTNCDYMDNCIYNDGDKVLVYGTINSFGWSIIVDQHCIDPNYEKSQEEEEEVKNNNDENIDTTHTITIIDDDLTAEKEDQYIMWKSYQNINIKEIEVEEDKRCEELSNEFMLPGTVYCSRMLGIGIWNGECTYISGCSENGYEFFTTMSECKIACGNSNIDISNIFDERTKDNNDNEEEEEDILSPSISLGRPIVPKNYIPYEGITACITNNLDKSIFIPGRCSVFTLSSMDGNNTIVTEEEDEEECYKGEKHIIQELRPKEEYCSNYYLHFHHESNNYTISAKYCTTIIEYDFLLNSLPFDETCFEVYTVETDGVEVTCPDMVDCMPSVPEALGEICSISGSRDLFIEECPNTLILD